MSNTDFPDVTKGAWADMATYVMDLSSCLGQELYIELCDEKCTVEGWNLAFFDEVVTYYETAPDYQNRKDIVPNGNGTGMAEIPWRLADNTVSELTASHAISLLDEAIPLDALPGTEEVPGIEDADTPVIPEEPAEPAEGEAAPGEPEAVPGDAEELKAPELPEEPGAQPEEKAEPGETDPSEVPEEKTEPSETPEDTTDPSGTPGDGAAPGGEDDKQTPADAERPKDPEESEEPSGEEPEDSGEGQEEKPAPEAPGEPSAEESADGEGE